MIGVFHKFSLSSIAIFIVVFSCLFIDFGFRNWEKPGRIIRGDIHSYYAYLPAGWIYKDVHLKKSDYQYNDRYWFFWPNYLEDGKAVIKTTMGVAVLYAPFFLVAHIITNLSDYPENGFSEPYAFMLLISAVFYLFVALDFLRKILAHYKFSDSNIAITSLLIGLGTNLTAYASQSAPMPHVYSFFLFSVFIYQTIRWFENPTVLHTVFIGLLVGLISLIRPSNVVICIFFVFYNVTAIQDLKERAGFFVKKMPLLLLMLFVAFTVWIPQLVYWKLSSGHYLYDSYPDEQFFFNNPKIIEGLLGFRKGWLIYTPMMLFAIAGLFVMRDSLKQIRIAIVVFFIINSYIIFSWWCWWYGGSFGQRSMVDCYALLAIPFAAFVEYISEKKLFYTIGFYSATLFFVGLNLFQTLQYEHIVLHYDSMTSKLYFKQFGKLERVTGYNELLESPNYENAKKGINR